MIVDVLPGFFFGKRYFIWTNSDNVSVLFVQSLLVSDQPSAKERDDVRYAGCRPRLGSSEFG